MSDRDAAPDDVRGRATGASTGSDYDHAYYQGGGKSNYVDYSGQAAVVENYWFPLIERYRKGLGGTGPGNLLDVGCAYGFLVDTYRRRGWKADGCDISAFAIAEGERRGITGLRLGALPALQYPSGAYDLVTCLDVIEHLTPDVYRDYLAEFHRVLRPGGVAVIATPNAIDCSGYNVFSPDWVEGDETHINYRSSLELAADCAAFARVVVHGASPTRGMFSSFRPFGRLPRKGNGLIRWILWRLLGNDLQHATYLIAAARR